MTDNATKAEVFKALHTKGDPLVLYNIWDAGGARALAQAGSRAVATGSWSMAAAHGFEDGEQMPLDLVVQLVGRIAATVDLPLSVDFEGGFAVAPHDVAQNVKRIIEAGAIGINFEDRIVGGKGLHPVQAQAARIQAVRRAADEAGCALFINARTDLFLGSDPATHKGHIDEALTRAAAYRDAGADGFFVPGLGAADAIKKIVDAVSLPVNVMMTRPLTSLRSVADLGVARASYGPGPYARAMSDLKAHFTALN